MSSILIKNATIINENSREISDLLITNNRIEKIDKNITTNKRSKIIEAEGLFLIPGLGGIWAFPAKHCAILIHSIDIGP